MTTLSNIITPSNVLTTTNTATVTNKTLTAPTVSGMVVSDGTANGVTYLNGSKVLTSGSALTFTGTRLGIGEASPVSGLTVKSGNGDQATFNNAGERFTQLTLQNNGTSKGALWLDNTNSLLELYGYSGMSLTFSANATEGMRLTSTGLGIGTSSPANPTGGKGFEISNASGASIRATNSATYLELQSGGSANYILSNGAYPLLFYTNGSERMRLDSAGNLGVNTTSPSYKIDAIGSTTTNSGIVTTLRLKNGGEQVNDGAKILFTSGTSTEGAGIGSGGQALNSADLRFYTGGNTERARIDSSGNLLVGTTSATQGGASVFGCFSSDFTSKYGIGIATTQTSGTGLIMTFVFNGTQVGSIANNSVLTAYNTSSDYRLKNSIAPMTGALAKVAQLKPCTYKWNTDNSDGEGFIAHELAEVVPQCVTGVKDGVNEDGTPKYQGIDTSFLVATLTAALQEQQAIIESLKARLDAANL